MNEIKSQPKIMAFVMAGSEGSRLQPLTEKRCKPGVSFGGRYRIVDFVLSNLINSEIRSIYLLVQYKFQSLIEHIRRAWTISPLLPEYFVTIVPPKMHRCESWFTGTADSVYQNLSLIKEHQPDFVVVFGADHIYRVDIRQMVRFHIQPSADVSLAALPVLIEQSSSFGVIEADADGRVKGFQKKPAHPRTISTDPSRGYASMGNYIFNTTVLIEALEVLHQREETDFGRHMLPMLLQSHRLFAYDFASNEVPGIKSYEEKDFWRDVGTLVAYFDAHFDVLGMEPRFDAFNSQWPIYSSGYQGPGARIGFDLEENRRRYHVTPTGLVVVPLGEISYFARNSRGKGPGYNE